MLIKNIKFNEKNFLFEIEIDVDESIEKYSISYEVYEELELKEGLEIDTTFYNKILSDNNYQSAKKIAENFINYKFRSSKEVRYKLYTKIKDKESIGKVIIYFTKLSLIDDDRYAREYIDYLVNTKFNSIAFTKYKLREKGIDDAIYNKYLLDIDENVELNNIRSIFEKKYSNIDLSNPSSKQKVYRYLSSKGFRYQDINRIIDENK